MRWCGTWWGPSRSGGRRGRPPGPAARPCRPRPAPSTRGSRRPPRPAPGRTPAGCGRAACPAAGARRPAGPAPAARARNGGSRCPGRRGRESADRARRTAAAPSATAGTPSRTPRWSAAPCVSLLVPGPSPGTDDAGRSPWVKVNRGRSDTFQREGDRSGPGVGDDHLCAEPPTGRDHLGRMSAPSNPVTFTLRTIPGRSVSIRARRRGPVAGSGMEASVIGAGGAGSALLQAGCLQLLAGCVMVGAWHP